MKESDLYPKVRRLLEDRGYQTWSEVPTSRIMPLWVDVVGVDPSTSKLISIEVKLQNWKSVLSQGWSRLFFSDQVYVAFPESYGLAISAKIEEYLDKLGIGLMLIDHEAYVTKEPRESAWLDEMTKQAVLERLKTMESG